MHEDEGRLVAELREAGKLDTDKDVEDALRLAFRYGRATKARCPSTLLTIVLALLIGLPIAIGVAIAFRQ